jgi:hypothetical protein
MTVVVSPSTVILYRTHKVVDPSVTLFLRARLLRSLLTHFVCVWAESLKVSKARLARAKRTQCLQQCYRVRGPSHATTFSRDILTLPHSLHKPSWLLLSSFFALGCCPGRFWWALIVLPGSSFVSGWPSLRLHLHVSPSPGQPHLRQ